MTTYKKIKEHLSHPNNLTLFRVAAIPGVVVLLYFPNRFSTFSAAILFSLAAISDFLDGFFARKKGLVSNFGKIMDPLADKMLISSAFIMLSAHGWVPAWVICVIIGRELAVTGLRNVVTDKGGDVGASHLGKWKVGFQVAAIIPLIFHFEYFGVDLHAIGTFFLWGALVFSVWSGVDYFVRYKRMLEF